MDAPDEDKLAEQGKPEGTENPGDGEAPKGEAKARKDADEKEAGAGAQAPQQFGRWHPVSLWADIKCERPLHVLKGVMEVGLFGLALVGAVIVAIQVDQGERSLARAERESEEAERAAVAR